MSLRDLIIVGAGPSGLAAAIAAKKAGLEYQVIEQGTLVNSIYRWPPLMVFFTTPELLEIGGLPFVSPYDKPTRNEALRYYRKVVDTYDLNIAYDEKVVAIRPDTDEDAGAGGPAEETIFTVETESATGVRRVRSARNVVVAIGYYDRPVMLGIPGEDLPHVSHYYGEPHPYYRKRVVVVGGANSAADASLEMFRAGAHVTLVHRWPELKPTIKYWVRPDIENRIKEGSIAAHFGASVTRITPQAVTVLGPDGVVDIPAEAVFVLTGYRADTQLMVDAGVRLTDRDAPVFDSSTFETNVPGLFVAGGALAGIDTGTVFIENGRFHGETIVAVISGRR